MSRPVIYSFLILALLTPFFAQATTPHTQESGILYATYFSPKEYQANPQNWAVLQKRNGVMVFGNGDGVMTFDGAQWKLLPLANNNLVRSLAFDNEERIYVGGYNEIGYLSESSKGNSSIVSLLNKLTDDQKEFGHVWNIVAADNNVYFATDKNILAWNGNIITEIKIPFENKRSFATLYQNKVLVQPAMESLLVLQNDKLNPLPGGEFYKGKRITGILPYDTNKALVCTLEDGLYLYDGEKSIPFQSEVSNFLKENRLYKAIQLKNGNFAFGTLLRGIVIIDKQGALIHLVEKGRGLGDNAVYNLEEDRQGSLWVTLSVGISRVELQAPMTWFDERNGLTGAVNDIIRYEGDLYAATMLGFYKLQRGSSFSTPSSFIKVDEIPTSVWAMTLQHGSLLLATDNGTVELKNGKYKFLDDFSGAVILPSRYDPSVVYVGLADGVVVLRFEAGQWKSMGSIPNVEADVGEMNEDVQGNLWLGTFSEGVIQLQFPIVRDKREYLQPIVSRYGAKDGLPVGYVQITRVGDELIFRVEPHHTVYRFDFDKTIFTHFSFKPKFPQYDSLKHFPFTNELNGKLWMVNRTTSKSTFDFLMLTSVPAGYNHELISFSRVREDVDEVIYMEENGNAWLGGLDGIVRFDYKAYPKRNLAFNVVLNAIKLNNDSIFYTGTAHPMEAITLPYDFNTVAFSFAATTYDLHEENEYQYLLDGFDDDWSPWTRNIEASYTRISEGDYVFKVRAKNIYGDLSPETKYAFTISPPWYRHFLAYIAYAVLLVTIVYKLVKLRMRKFEREKMSLEKIIQERTTEISSKNKQLEQQAEELKTQTEQLKEMDQIKSNFFTNISHEFRTPLSLIIAPLERELMETTKRPETEMMYRNARRLQTLINQLLDLSKLESGKMKVFLCKNDLTTFVGTLLSSFHGLAQSKNISFRQSLPETPTDAYFDADKLETILNNLLSNAFKFTPEGGEVSFSMTVFENEERCEFTVSDTGPGIHSKDLPKIFDRFYQVDADVQREFEGSGIGLALTKELVLLMGGDIDVSSEPGKGTKFRVALPYSQGQNSIIPQEIDFNYARTNAAPATDPYVQNDTVHNKTYTVLLVEDNKDLSTYLSGILEKIYTVKVAGNGEEGLAIAKEEIPDLIISDMMMPKMDGFTLCEEMRKNEGTSHIPFILLTARSSVETRLAGLELGADDYMTKPFNVTELQIRVKNLLHQRDNLKKLFRQELKLAPKDITVTSTDEKFLLRVMEIVESKMTDINFSVEQLSEEVGMSRKNLHRKLVALVDQTPNEFIRIFRLKTAMQLLEQQSGTVKEVAFGVGFNNLSYFAKCFKEQFGISPAEVIVQNKVNEDVAGID